LKKNKIYLIVTFIATLDVSIAAILIRQCVSSYLLIGFYRMLFSGIFLLPLIFTKNNLQSTKQIIIKSWKLLIIVGIALGLHFTFWNMSLSFTTIGNSVFLVNTSPIMVVIFSYLLFKEKLNSIQIFGIVIGIAGSLFITLNNLNFGTYWFGDFLAILGALMLSIYLIGGRRLRKKYDLIPYVLLIYFFSTTTLFLSVLLIDGHFYLLSIFDLLFIFLLSIICTIFGHTLYNFTLKKISASVISMILLLEPVLSTIYAIFIFNEIPTYNLLIGGSFIIIGIILVIKNNLNSEF